MKKILLLLIISMTVSCGNVISLMTGVKVDNELLLNYNKSYQKWLAEKEKHQDNYLYETIFVSWTGSGHSTTFTVQKGKVISREYQTFKIMDFKDKTIISEWKEDISELNSHNEGDKVLTIEQIYQECKGNLSQNPKENIISFEMKNDGLISSCGYIPRGCADDCFIGASISKIVW